MKKHMIGPIFLMSMPCDSKIREILRDRVDGVQCADWQWPFAGHKQNCAVYGQRIFGRILRRSRASPW
jgi:hypothetical protein